MAHRYPGAFPLEEVTTLVNFVRGDTAVTQNEAIEAAWWVLGYGLSVAVPAPHEGLKAQAEVKYSQKALLKALKQASANHDKFAGSIPWLTLVKLLLAFLKGL